VSRHPQDFCEKIEAAIRDELTAVGEYAALARDTEDQVLRMILYSVAGDEYGHARTFETIKNCYCRCDDDDEAE